VTIVASKHDLAPEHQPGQPEHTVSTRVMEIVVAAAFMLVAALVMWDSRRVGAGWAFDGPEAGYFPFYIGVIMFISGAVIFVTNIVTKTPDLSNFVDRSALWLVLKVLIPTAGFVVLTNLLGIYVAAAIFIAFFMWWLGNYRLAKAIPVGVAVPLVLFWVFEIAFLIPLPKGPLEAALGY
jgi:putative tricarboxylic transport membrane protein